MAIGGQDMLLELTETLANLLKVVISPGMEADLQKREAKINRLMVKVKQEVYSAHMHFVHHQLANIGKVVGGLAKSQPMAMNLSAMRMIPHSRNDRFFGRSSILKDMDRILLPSSSENKQRFFALHGHAGSGKTQIALQFTYSRAHYYSMIMWILASSFEKIEQGFRDAAKGFGMDPKACEDPGQAKDFVLRRLSSSSKWTHPFCWVSSWSKFSTASDYLIVYDNIDDASLTGDIIPHGDRGAIITTSRNSVFSEDLTLNNHQVLDFSFEEGCGFLLSSLPTIINTSVGDSVRQTIEIFNGYPLALAVIAGLVRTSGCSLLEFLNIYKNKKYSKDISRLRTEHYHADLATVFEISLASLDDESRTILEVFSLVDPDSLPYEFFTRGAPDQHQHWSRLQFMADPLRFFAAIRKLRSQSLVRINSELCTLSVHRYFQASIRENIISHAHPEHDPFEEAIHLLTTIQPEFMNDRCHWNPQNWNRSKKYLPHITALEHHFLENPSRFKSCATKLAKLVFHSATWAIHHVWLEDYETDISQVPVRKESLSSSNRFDGKCTTDSRRSQYY